MPSSQFTFSPSESTASPTLNGNLSVLLQDKTWEPKCALLKDGILELQDTGGYSKESSRYVLDSQCLLTKDVENDPQSAFIFQLLKPGEFQLCVRASSEDDRDCWMESIRMSFLSEKIYRKHSSTPQSKEKKILVNTPTQTMIEVDNNIPTTPSNNILIESKGAFNRPALVGKHAPKYLGSYVGSTLDGLRDGIGTYTLDSIRYEGEWHLNFMHGQGIMTSEDSTVYNGSWKNGQQHGTGTLRWPDGTEYVGEWSHGQRSGRGEVKSPPPKNMFYTGSFVNGVISGFGTMRWTNGNEYTGMFRRGKGHGIGTMLYGSTGDVYKGEFKKGRRHGTGTLSLIKSGITFEGKYVSDSPSNVGILYYSDGGVFRGSISEWKRSGNGRMQWPNGDRYEGNWRNDLPDGQGMYQYVLQACTYGGNFKSGQRHGPGKMLFESGLEYDGMWRFNEANGMGRMTYPNGNQYNGEWKNSRRHGQGHLSFKSGAAYEGEFSNGWPCGQGAFVHESGVHYEGGFQGWLRQGKGVMSVNDDVNLLIGIWRDDVLFEIEDITSVESDSESEDEEIERAVTLSDTIDFLPLRRDHFTTQFCFSIQSMDVINSLDTSNPEEES